MARGRAIDMSKYELVKRVQRPSGVYDEIYRPILSPEERERRFEHFKDVCASVMTEYYEEKERREREGKQND